MEKCANTSWAWGSGGPEFIEGQAPAFYWCGVRLSEIAAEYYQIFIKYQSHNSEPTITVSFVIIRSRMYYS